MLEPTTPGFHPYIGAWALSDLVERAALDGFHALAFPELADAARRELRASGETVSRRAPDGWAHVTPQELQIAQLASIGQQLFLSTRTVQSHR